MPHSQNLVKVKYQVSPLFPHQTHRNSCVFQIFPFDEKRRNASGPGKLQNKIVFKVKQLGNWSTLGWFLWTINYLIRLMTWFYKWRNTFCAYMNRMNISTKYVYLRLDICMVSVNPRLQKWIWQDLVIIVIRNTVSFYNEKFHYVGNIWSR